MPGEFLFCPMCRSTLEPKVRGGKPRPQCPACGYVQYRNPVAGVAVICHRGRGILMGRRAAGQSRGGEWCIPCGYVEWGEDIREAARREMLEETGLIIEVGPVYDVHSNFHDPKSLTVGVWFTGTIIGGTMNASDDVDMVDFFPLDQIPEPLAFPTDRLILDRLRREGFPGGL